VSAGVRHPPGRGGRLWLQGRLATAHRAAGLLDVKLRILRTEQERLAALAASSEERWQQACAEAERWLLRAAAVGGQRGLRREDGGQAEVDLRWGAVMGVRYPVSATCRFPPEATAVAATAAVPVAAAAYRTALEAGVAHAAARAAAEVVAAEVTTTRSRLRAIEDRWVPGLQEALRVLELSLDEQERADGLRLRWAAARRPGLVPPSR
jgi:V/A-type H+-transporting ATPase subunit D